MGGAFRRDERSHYDEFGKVALDAGFDPEEARKVREEFGSRFGFGGGASRAGPEDGFHFADIDDLLGQMFARQEGAGPTRQFRGADLEASLDLEFLEAVRGGEKRLTLGRAGFRRNDDGHGHDSKFPLASVPTVAFVCPVKAHRESRWTRGDLWVSLRIRPHPVFRRDGKNLSLDLPITVREAIAGCRSGGSHARRPRAAHDSSGYRWRKTTSAQGQRRAGIWKGGGGDLLVRVQIKVPKDLDEEPRPRSKRLSPSRSEYSEGALLMSGRRIRTEEVLLFLGVRETR